MFEKQKITDILPTKSGIGKNGKPYSFYKIKTDRWNDKILTTFGNATTAQWRVGDEIEIKVTETKSADGKYTNYNFELPKKNDVALEIVKRLEITVDVLKRRIERLEIEKANKPEFNLTSAGTKVPDFSEVDDIKYPEEDINPDLLPF